MFKSCSCKGNGTWNGTSVQKYEKTGGEGTLFCTVSSLVTCNVLGKSIEERQDWGWDHGIEIDACWRRNT
jgi:hypothetical protein